MTAITKPPSNLAQLPEKDLMPTYDVRDIVQKDGQARLVLDEAVYTLRITRAGKLILTK
ncbi:hemin uptake protein HemP [Sulfitobacter donghicola]|uniref:Hemin uptake protein hemP n=1 Tax=Sulfitobacter donghicola DSW-25 = KCTC 12864 = JCM 14565 TaxID=1300350 RepID=A0A073IT07_9RHOB|nr:hypothetical protein DSW25_15585 [Sulfitobacter donghicola DSW-25 = KCTC 12864 = JCM 14565]